MSVTISILCFNRLDFTRRCLHSVLRHSPPGAQIIVTDNGSTDGTWDHLQSLRSDRRLEFVQFPENVGITRAKNRAFALARFEEFVSLDNDAVVDGRGWLAALKGELDRAPAVAQVGWRAPHVSCALGPNGMGYPNHDQVEYVEGSVMMVRRSAALAAGGLCDPVYPFAYCEDADLSLRLRMRGWQVATVPLPVTHPHESEKKDHGGVNLGPHHALQHGIFRRRWKAYLERKRFNWSVLLVPQGPRDVDLAVGLTGSLQAQMPSAEIRVGNPILEGVADYVVPVGRDVDLDSLVYRLNTALPVTLTTRDLAVVETAERS